MDFEKQRDLLLQEITSGIDAVVYNLDVLNRSLHDSIQVGKEFENVGNLWATFYDQTKSADHVNTAVGAPASPDGGEGEKAV